MPRLSHQLAQPGLCATDDVKGGKRQESAAELQAVVLRPPTVVQMHIIVIDTIQACCSLQTACFKLYKMVHASTGMPMTVTYHATGPQPLCVTS